ncbi:superoxide dismutase copper chaperone Lys7, putative [Cordyceps militaris CM01]|uniref:Superoxide dismutase 1 copper chaperone n=1 Tax=Cordyceps militaris (strain CM01) TaxID=983644 RepID=G3JUA1_CORMM|nr:superoxide dismutase copper chaperone Lys7, putative [Cordyceps militaris CM01]EGX87808.1 superoxide dismutase copper chaperone Lys7, putative [Cordyceps militaris CM01]
MTVNHTFQTLFAVPLSCDGCIKSVSDALYSLGGITKVEGNLQDQLIAVEGSGTFHHRAAPSSGAQHISVHTRSLADAFSTELQRLRPKLLKRFKIPEEMPSCEDQDPQTYANKSLFTGAAVSILESFAESLTQQQGNEDPSREVRGLARMVEVGAGRTLVDLTVRGVSPGTYRATIRQYGDLKDGAESTGPVWTQQQDESQPRGLLGTVEVGTDGRGSVFVDRAFHIWEVIGHAMVLTKQAESAQLKNDADTVVGVIARSSGMWDNDKTVCSCTGKTLWEERKDEVAKGML